MILIKIYIEKNGETLVSILLTVVGSLLTEAVKPAAEEPFPEVYIPIGEHFSTNFNS